MVLFYGLFALETANNTVAATTAAAAISQQGSISKKSKPYVRQSSSSNSWIYTEDLRKRFEERYTDYRYIFVPVYINGKTSGYNYSSTAMISPKQSSVDNSWMYSRSLRDHLFYSTSKISSSTCCVTNQAFMRNGLPRKKDSKFKIFKRPSSSLKDKSTTSLASTCRPHTSSLLSFNTTKYRTHNSVVLEEEDDENTENDNHSIPLIKHNCVIPPHTTTTTKSLNNNSTLVNTTMNSELTTNAKHVSTQNNRLTRLRSFFFKSTSSLSGTQQ